MVGCSERNKASGVSAVALDDVRVVDRNATQCALEWTPGLKSQSVIFRDQCPSGQGPLIVFWRCGLIHGPVFMGPKIGQNRKSEPQR